MGKNMKKIYPDEMQDQKMLKLEEYGFWIVFWGLAVIILVQLVTGGTIRQIAGELAALFIGSVFITVTYLKNGLWTRNSTPTRKRNALTSIIPAALLGVIHIIKIVKNQEIKTNDILITAAVVAAAYAACFIVLELFRTVYQKRRSKLDDTGEENE